MALVRAAVWNQGTGCRWASCCSWSRWGGGRSARKAGHLPRQVRCRRQVDDSCAFATGAARARRAAITSSRLFGAAQRASLSPRPLASHESAGRHMGHGRTKEATWSLLAQLPSLVLLGGGCSAPAAAIGAPLPLPGRRCFSLESGSRLRSTARISGARTRCSATNDAGTTLTSSSASERVLSLGYRCATSSSEPTASEK